MRSQLSMCGQSVTELRSQSGDPGDVGLQTTFEQCVQSEQDVREQLKKAWSSFSAADKQHCVTLAKTGGESSNTELLTCLEMARDVRTIRSTGTSGKATTPIPSLPSRSVVLSVFAVSVCALFALSIFAPNGNGATSTSY